jgi:hypothetical protein
MKKLALSVHGLRVESFSTSPAIEQWHGGTVKAHQHTVNGTGYNATSPGETCPSTTEWGAVTCFAQSCYYVCESGDCPTRFGDTCAAC